MKNQTVTGNKETKTTKVIATKKADTIKSYIKYDENGNKSILWGAYNKANKVDITKDVELIPNKNSVQLNSTKKDFKQLLALCLYIHNKRVNSNSVYNRKINELKENHYDLYDEDLNCFIDEKIQQEFKRLQQVKKDINSEYLHLQDNIYLTLPSTYDYFKNMIKEFNKDNRKNYKNALTIALNEIGIKPNLDFIENLMLYFGIIIESNKEIKADTKTLVKCAKLQGYNQKFVYGIGDILLKNNLINLDIIFLDGYINKIENNFILGLYHKTKELSAIVDIDDKAVTL